LLRSYPWLVAIGELDTSPLEGQLNVPDRDCAARYGSGTPTLHIADRIHGNVGSLRDPRLIDGRKRASRFELVSSE